MTKKKNLALIICLVLVTALVSVGGTLAWLTDKTETVENTFTVGNIDIAIDETTGDDYKMVPGTELSKDPSVTVLADSEACWLFVKVEEANELTKYITYNVDTTVWTELDGVDGVYYKAVDTSADNQKFNVLTGDKVLVNSSVTKGDMNALELLEKENYPKLSFTAYAIQQAKFTTATAAWEALNPPVQP